ncbi:MULTISPECIES: metalloregulator ArsR/SmtB family transcription factor [unclassified Rhizobium]|uniref:metalloregulator ArsR/SmtB family transcription factor n=1 Tax=unclassified Rhizobium TaxID=2613769 RepID=UPI000781CA29|nr:MULTISPECIES: metalloregulator ArsR/SmtB family transcription factor [unclassified Rhizobium]
MAKKNKTDVHPAMDKTSSRVFHALASDPRRMMLVHLSQSTLTAGEIAARFDMAKPSISQHLSILENAELIEGEKKGQYIHYSLRPEALRHALKSMLETIDASAESKADSLDTGNAKAENKGKSKPKSSTADAEVSAKMPTKAKGDKVKKAEQPAPPPPQQMGLLDLLGMDA